MIPRFASVLLLALATGSSPQARPRALTDLSDVQACLPLPEGKLLLGTAGGLARLGADDGLERVWTRLDGLPGTRIHALLRDGERGVWIGTDRGLAWMDGAGRRLRLVARSRPVRALTRHRGTLYVGTWDGAFRLQAGRRLVPLRTAGAALRITALASHGGALYLGTAGAGLWTLKGSSRLEQHARGGRLPSPFIWSLASSKGRLLVGTLAGLTALDGDGGATPLSSVDARALHVASGGEVLVGSYGAGLSPRPAGWRGPAADGFVNAIAAHGRTICVGTRDGAWIARPGRTQRHVRLSGPPSNDISALAADGERLYVGTFDGGLSVLERGRWRPVRGVDARVDALALQGRTLWIGTSRGLYRRQPDGRIRRFGTADGLRHQHVHSLLVLRSGELLAGTGRGAVIIHGERVEPITVKQGLPVASIWAAAEDAEGGLWLGTSRGLYHWSRAQSRYRRYSVSSGHLEDDWVTALTLHDGAVYVGTYNAGVSRLDRGAAGGWTSAHLGGGWVNFAGLRVVGPSLYAACMSGLFRAPLSGAAGFELVPRAAPGRDVTAVAPAGAGRLWVASRRGLALQ